VSRRLGRALLFGARLGISAVAVVCLPVTSLTPAEPERDLATPPGGELNRLWLPGTLTMEPIRSAEIFSGGSFAVVFDGNHIRVDCRWSVGMRSSPWPWSRSSRR